MEGVQRIRQRILEDAREQANSIIAECQKQADEIIAQARKDAEKLKQSLIQKYTEQGEEVKKRTKSMAELEMRKEILAVKQKMVDAAFAQALGRMKGLQGQEYEKMLEGMLIRASQVGDEEIVLSPEDRKKFTPELLERVNKALKAAGKKGQLKLSSETRSMQGGFVLKGDGMEINNSFEAILRMARDEIEPQIVELLFGE